MFFSPKHLFPGTSLGLRLTGANALILTTTLVVRKWEDSQMLTYFLEGGLKMLTVADMGEGVSRMSKKC